MYSWYLYLVSCKDGTFYTGITTDVTRRIYEHNASTKGARYTRTRRPVVLVYSEACASRSDASKKEYVLRHLTHREKMLISTRTKT